MDTPVSHHAASIAPEPAEAGKSVWVDAKTVGIKGHFGSWPKPKVPIQVRWRVSIRRIPDALREAVAKIPGTNEADLPNVTISDELYRLLEVQARTLLSADLNDALVAARCLNHLLALLEVYRDRLFHVAIFARLTGHYGVQSVPVIGRRDNDRLNFFHLQDVSKVSYCFCLRTSDFGRRI